MELKLESGLEHQMLAVDAISNVFKMVEIDQEVPSSSNPIVNLGSSRFATNIRAIQRKETQNVAEKFRAAQPIGNTLCLDIKMETGTGKTYVYTHTIFELHKLYGINKFIIAVPSIPIKEGTGAFLNETYARAHFKNTLGYDAEISVGVLEAEKKFFRLNVPEYNEDRLKEGVLSALNRPSVCIYDENCGLVTIPIAESLKLPDNPYYKETPDNLSRAVTLLCGRYGIPYSTVCKMNILGLLDCVRHKYFNGAVEELRKHNQFIIDYFYCQHQ